MRPRRLWLHAALFFVTLVTCSATGSRLVENFHRNLPSFRLEQDLLLMLWPVDNPAVLLTGLPFSLALLFILLAHEMGHYLACVHYRLDASLPYFLPAPSFIGTFGAFIRIRSIIYSRKVLFDVGVAGPLAGFVALMPLLLIGISMSKRLPGIAHEGDILFGTPVLITLVERFFFPGVPSADIYLHPLARAAWVGLFATALNLLPVGQLDGGHILYALFGERHKTISKFTLAALIPLGFLYWPWWVWAVGLYFIGRKHPFIYDDTPIGATRVVLSIVALLLFLLSFMPAPISA